MTVELNLHQGARKEAIADEAGQKGQILSPQPKQKPAKVKTTAGFLLSARR
ncbi:hypothetical protein [Aminobacter sp. LjRoot7]|uniref:hypothetical protein n=1 Tax=Aminobacter sp. LjRoot7 TaxID=3342335 RepID=UPI003F4F6478